MSGRLSLVLAQHNAVDVEFFAFRFDDTPARSCLLVIQRVIIDGFKSYANRTVVDNFDPEFNAITGLNGSGDAPRSPPTLTRSHALVVFRFFFNFQFRMCGCEPTFATTLDRNQQASRTSWTPSALFWALRT